MSGIMLMRLSLLLLLLSPLSSLAQAPLSMSDAERLFRSGLELIDKGNYGAAREAFDKYLDMPEATGLNKTEANYYKAYTALKLHHPDGEKLILNYLDEYPSNPRSAFAYFDLANFFYDERNYTKAVNYYKQINYGVLNANQFSQAKFRWAYSLFNLRRLKEALEQFNFIKSQNNQFSAAASYYAGFIEYGEGDYDRALVDLQKAAQSPGYANVAPHLIASIYYKQQKYDELLAYAEPIINQGKEVNELAEIYLLVAEAYFKKKNYAEASKRYEAYFERKRDAERPAYLRAGYAYYSTGDDASALNYFKRSASDKDSTGYCASYYLGILYLKQGEKQQALTSFDNARKFTADKNLVEEASFHYAKVAYDLGRTEPAIAEFEKYITDNPQGSYVNEAKELLSQAYVNANNYNKAIAYIESLPRRNPNLDRAYQKATYLKAVEHFNKNEYAEAVTFFERSLKYPLDDEYTALAAFWCAEAYSIGKKFDEAIIKYQRVQGLPSQKNSEAAIRSRYGLGYAYFNEEAYAKALVQFKEFLGQTNTSNPNYADAVLRLADCYYVARNYNDALLNYRKSISSRTPDADYAYLQVANILGIQRKYDEAASTFSQVIMNYPRSRFIDEAYFQKAQFELEQGNYPAAQLTLTQLINTQRNSKYLPYAYLRRAAAHYNLKDYNATINDYLKVLQDFANHPVASDALLPLQEALNLQNRGSEFENVLAAFRQANPEKKGLEAVEFESAKSLYFNQDYARSIPALTRYITSYPESPRRSEAKYYLAESYYRQRDFDKALPIYAELEADKNFNLAARVVARIAELEFRLGNYDNAKYFFHKQAAIASSKRDQYNAWSGLMEAHFLLAAYDSVEYYAKQIMERANINAGAQNKAALYLGKSAMAKGDYETAKDEFIAALNTARDEYGAEAKYLLAEIFYLAKEYRRSYEILVELNSDFAAYQEWVGKSYLLLADNFLAMGDTFQAKGTLNSLIANHPLEEIKAKARAKLRSIEQSEIKSSTNPSTDTTRND
ncbi:MAG TPA: tetratricopeptide repeat protein [Cyclobacteriaceae bacterium]|nr:tetratricopeptide repeat protein [Cyclobacteriaceae bacterium]